MRYNNLYELISREKYNEAILYIESNKIDENFKIIYKALIACRKGELESAEHELKRFDNSEVKDVVEVLAKNTIVSLIYFWTGNSDFITLVDETFEFIFENNDNSDYPVDWKYWIGYLYLVKGSYFVNDHKFQISLVDYKKAISIAEEIQNEELLIRGLSNLGLVYVKLFEFLEAFNVFNRIIAKFEGDLTNSNVIIALANIGEIFQLKGDYKTALSYYYKAKVGFEKDTNSEYLAMLKSNTSNINFEIGKFDLAVKEARESLEIRVKIGNPIYISESLLILIRLFLETKQFSKAKSYYEKLEILHQNNFDNYIVKFNLQLAEVLLNSSKEDNSEISKSIKTLEYLIYNDYKDPFLTHVIYKLLVNLKIKEVQMMENNFSLEDLKSTSEYIENIAKKTDSITLKCYRLLLESYILLFQGEINQALEMNDQAYRLALKNNKSILSLAVFQEKDKILKIITSQQSNLGSMTQSIDIELLPKIFDYYQIMSLDEFFYQALNSKSIFLHRNLKDVLFFHDFYDKNDSLKLELNTFLTPFIMYLKENSMNNYFYFPSEYGSILICNHKNLTICLIYEGSSFLALEIVRLIFDTIQLETRLYEKLINGDEISKEEYERIIGIFSTSLGVSKEENDVLVLRDVPESSPYSNYPEFKILMHPLRILILKKLVDQFKVYRSEFQKIFKINSELLTTHINELKRFGLIDVSYEFDEGNPNQVLTITDAGMELSDELNKKISDIQ
jgi:tetratricopeptide (TPR) repeat protein